jgi:succinate-semialdehyde dehydrogenase/glutarate-semialdehyde dehydrogenase
MAKTSLRDPSLLVDRCYVGGSWTGVPETPVVNPATGEELARVPNFGAPMAVSAVEAAVAAFGPWSKRLAKERSQILRNWFQLIMENKADLAAILTSEQGKPLAEASGEIEYAASFVEFYAEEAKRLYGETIPTYRADARIMVVRQPVGVVAAITPWNFPAAMITRKIAPAIAAGCTTVVKPAPETPLTALALAVLAERAGVPAGVLNVITGDAPAIGSVLTTHPAVRAVGFTGSTEVGKILMRQSASTVKRVALELGGNAPFIVFDDADIPAAVQGVMASKFRNMGQTCVCANRIYAQDRIYDRFVNALKTSVEDLKVGNGTEAGVTQGPLITSEAVDKVERHIADAVQHGARIVTGGKRHALGGNFFQPTVLADVTDKTLITQEETFGPLAPVYRFNDEADVIAQANASPYGLAAYFYARDLGRVFRVAEALETGMVGVNSGAISTEIAPFGGIKESGIGREGSRHGIEEYTQLKYVLLAGLDT